MLTAPTSPAQSIAATATPTSGNPPGRRYCLITPCRDEAEFARQTLDSVVAQTVPPALWVIVDDGSTDATPQILAEYAARYPFIRIVRRTDRGGRSVGPGVIEAFYDGLRHVNLEEFDYLCKLDLDLILPPAYFQTLMQRMEAEPRLGNCSGKPYYPGPDGQLISEGCGDENAIGASKFYRRQCFQQIGGFVRQVMWDGIDGHRCRMLGWIAASWDDPELRFIHLRPMGSSHKNILTGRMRHGFGQYFMGTSLLYITASAIFRLAQRPFIIGGLAVWWGYVRAMLRRQSRYDDPEFRTFVRSFQWACLLLGKRRATDRLNRRQASVWRPPSLQAPAAPHRSGSASSASL
jgi:biofilm PGA synthesis N-glycosyltransferase PgaC